MSNKTISRGLRAAVGCATFLALGPVPFTGTQTHALAHTADGQEVRRRPVDRGEADGIEADGIEVDGSDADRSEADGIQEANLARLTLEQLETMALENNPTLLQARAAVRAAEGLRVQAGLYPNPVMGLEANELSTRAPARTGEALFVAEQRIPLGGKLSLSRQVFARQKQEVEAQAQVQRRRVITAVRDLYYQALEAGRMVELRRTLADITGEAVEITGQLYNVGQADRPDLLAAEIEARRADLAHRAALDDRARVWRQLSAMVGDPGLEPSALAGSLDEPIPDLRWEDVEATLLGDSPELAVAAAGISTAGAAVDRARAEKVPDLVLRGGFGYNAERFEETGEAVGTEGFIEVGFDIPLFDRNQGNVAAAMALVDHARAEHRRVELSLQERLAGVFADYRKARTRVRTYREGILPDATRAYEQYLGAFREMRAAYPQVLIAQRTLVQARVDYVAALAEAWRSVMAIRGLLLGDGLTSPAATPEIPR